MTRATKCIGILFLGFLLFSCATWDKITGTTPEEKEKRKMSKDQLWDANKRYEADNQLLRRQIEQLKNNAIQNENEIKKLNRETAGLKQENRALKEDKRKLEAALTERETPKPAPPPAPAPAPAAAETHRGVEKLKIKVLGGDGKLRSANQMATRLREMGYKIQLIHLAPTSNFTRNTIFYAAEFKDEGKDLASRLGGTAVAKALTWASAFDLIVVTGKTP